MGKSKDQVELFEMSQTEKMGLSVPGISEADLPVIISGQVTKLNELDKSIKKAMKKAENAVDSAESAKSQSAGLFKKKAAIEELQSAGVDLADAVMSGAEAQKISFEFQRKLAEITKYLFGLGVSNIASNRSVVRELELRLKGASKEKLTVLAKQELMLVVKQLKDQEDILVRQEKMAAVVKSHDERLVEHSEKSASMEKVIAKQGEVDKQHGAELARQSETDRKLEKLLLAQDEVDKHLAERVAAQEATDQRLEKLLRVQDKVDKHLAEQVAAQHETDQRLEQLIRAQEEVDRGLAEQVAAQEVTDHRLEELISEQSVKIQLLEAELKEIKETADSKASKSMVVGALAVAVISMIVGVIF